MHRGNREDTMGEQHARTDEERAYYALNRRVYPSFAPFYDLVAWPLRRLRRDVASLIPLDAAARVLDVATGTGEQAFALAARAGEVVGVDLSEAMLWIAKRKNHSPKVFFNQADATELPFEDQSFDASCISFALHEMPPSIRTEVLTEMARVTKRGGTVNHAWQARASHRGESDARAVANLV
jgi:ubiquinone/menaquinone biosynthesis C-methylase UbiE